ncbi:MULTISPECIES: GspE/PulE family protein [unclassified Lentimonas]|uniref:GspE/PulE family protein n=1 Tax=unclassified Lentimonas TaxID=2630993 RepID=UPI0013284C6B|nr:MULTISPECIES: GspE/PulE family protein [unclassified Lentimonas]CAA6693839.1 Type IV fimbrial assembly, ATPase PilB [Lentimonas sp. CC19]CAA6695152.1 Type IV fimbrial assembly, ATPase PilB [Lentimonas sp. CC10]CAA7069712.1 Type IV fimbrial assembly, ATPase PilB [Lentimonas sp. CC11]
MALARIQASIVKNLLQMGRLTDTQCQKIIATEEDLSGVALENLLFEEYKISPFQVLVAKAEAFDLPPINVKRCLVTDSTFSKLEQDFCRNNSVLPLGVAGDYVIVAVSNPFDLEVINKVKTMSGMPVSVLLGLESAINDALQGDEGERQAVGFGDVVEALGMDFESDEESEDDFSDEESAPIIKLGNRIIEEAYFAGASDIHIEPFETETRVRVRIDGVLKNQLSMPPAASGALLARLKVMSELDIAEKRLPQDGRIQFKQFNKKGIDVDLRVATAPLNHGEGIVMRILDKQKSTLPLPALGFSEENLGKYRELITRPYGMVLHCGPTGSGKSMTLYSALNEINKVDVCIRTAEDPIEYTLPGLLQMQMQRKIGLTFATALRAFLRQDPDVILVGEIRDKETAGIAVEAALTGHMLFSTLHTNDAPTTISRLTEMGIEPFMISASLVCVCAQRLMRRVCKTCKQTHLQEGNEAAIMQRALGWSGKVPRASEDGCPSCGGNSYKGRVGIHELMPTSEELVAAINAEEEAVVLKRIAMRNGMKTLHQDCMLKVREGLTTMEEALGAVPPDMEEYEGDDEAAAEASS